MKCILLPSGDPYFNLAADEFFLRYSSEEYLILGINERSVIIGKHQIPYRETSTRFTDKHKIPVIRRISGGGTVYHDRGNLNFSFIMNSTEGRQVDFRKYTLPVISFLGFFGIDARFEGKNDLKTGGLKISGNAEHVFRKRVLHHGTLLFSADLELLRKCIRIEAGEFETRAVSSNPSPVTNLASMLTTVRDTIHFRNLMKDWFLDNYPGLSVSTLSESEAMKIRELAERRYMTWEWNYAYGPPYIFRTRFKFANKDTLCEISVKDGIINECRIAGHEDLKRAGLKLIGCRHFVNDVTEIMGKENIFKMGFDVYNLF